MPSPLAYLDHQRLQTWWCRWDLTCWVFWELVKENDSRSHNELVNYRAFLSWIYPIFHGLSIESELGSICNRISLGSMRCVSNNSKDSKDSKGSSLPTQYSNARGSQKLVETELIVSQAGLHLGLDNRTELQIISAPSELPQAYTPDNHIYIMKTFQQAGVRICLYKGNLDKLLPHVSREICWLPSALIMISVERDFIPRNFGWHESWYRNSQIDRMPDQQTFP